ncbi:cytochrome P450 [Kitasatospora sp. NPDC048365]|uniref:cytochrome P450 n=1 Tax=Kitasatospora sp. NPDC048365 TaxID=3364050 RepID=UPI003718B6CB
MATAVVREVPELDAAAVAEWRAGRRPLVELMARAQRELGGVAGFRLGEGPPTVVVTDPAAVQHVLALNPETYAKRSHRARMLVGDGVLSASGEAWRNQRRLLQAQFTGPGMRRYQHRLEAAARATAERWAGHARTGEPVDIGEEMRLFALDTVWRALTGHPVDAATAQALGGVAAVVEALPSLPADAVEPPPAVAADLARIDEVAHQAIAAARTGEAGPDGPGLLHLLVEAGEERPEYTDALIRDELVTLLMAGHETTASTLTWLYLLLDGAPEARGWALAAGPDGSAERRAAIDALASEALRLYPSAWMLPRRAVVDDVLLGHRIEAGSDVLSCPYLTHRDPGLWAEPGRFDPRRFTEPGGRPAQQGAYLPFGIGARACLGIRFAQREMLALLELLLPAHTVAFHAPAPAAAFGLTVRPTGPTPATIN